ncbi:sigma-70 family RNA polymerase sigma factor [soil metagenome]
MDRELLLRARAGDAEAFDLIVLAKGEPLFRTAVAILGNEADARDATQETLINAWRRLGQLRDIERFDAWLGRGLINQCRDMLRRRGRVREIAITPEWTERAADRSPGSESVDMRECLRRLTFDHRALLVLHHLHGYSVKEIGAWLGVPSGTVKWRLNRARRALRAELERDR